VGEAAGKGAAQRVACASVTLSPSAVTASTRPPSASSRSPSARVPAWKTWTPLPSAASIPRITEPRTTAPG
jgi:hypothetical protein